jgi:predicted dienelactone hydrolase
MTFPRLMALACGAAVFPMLGACTRPPVAPPDTESLALYDSLRRRPVPLTLYRPAGVPLPRRLALLSHGYGAAATDYSFLSRELVARGYLVGSIQHDLPGDAPIPTTGNLRETRRPAWQRGVENMRFVAAELRRRYPRLRTRRLLLLGHSNGGDMVMLFADQYPREVRYAISLDNRRMPLPRTRRPRVLSLRSSEQSADAGVLPGPDEQRRYRMSIVPLPYTPHNDLWDGATDAQKAEILGHLRRFLR